MSETTQATTTDFVWDDTPPATLEQRVRRTVAAAREMHDATCDVLREALEDGRLTWDEYSSVLDAVTALANTVIDGAQRELMAQEDR